MSDKPRYQVPQKTKPAQEFDNRPHVGTGGMKLNQLLQEAPEHAAVINAFFHQCHHVNGVVAYGFERDAQMTQYSEVNPAKRLGRLTELARGKMDPSRIMGFQRITKE